MDKAKIVAEVLATLEAQLATLVKSAKAAHAAATHEENRAEGQYDTRGLEASYLAGAQAQRAEELERLIALYKFLPVRSFQAHEPIDAVALVELETEEGTRSLCFLAPQGRSLTVTVGAKTVQVITPTSPIGQALLGKSAGDSIEIEVRGATRGYEVLAVC